MLKIGKDGLVTDDRGNLAVVPVDGFITGLGAGAGHDLIILRLYRAGAQPTDGMVHEAQAHQFVLEPHRAKALAHELLAYVAQVEKEGSNPRQQ